MKKLIDLHTHTTASDGSLPPSEFILKCKKEGLAAVAITDHDTANGVDECVFFGKKHGIEVISGTELSAEFPGELHILGLFIDHHSKAFKESKKTLSQYRAERNINMIVSLKENGFDISDVEAIKNTPAESLGRVHMAKALTAKGYAKDYDDAFKKFLTADSPYFIKRKKLSIKQCIDIIHNSGGLSFLAHPNHSEKTASDLETLVKILVGYGIDGIECYHSSMDKHHSDMALAMCGKYNLLSSAGSDFHGLNKPDVRLGHTYGGEPIYEDILERIKKQRDA